MCLHVLPLESRVAKFRCALPSNLRQFIGPVVSACEANCDPQGFLMALSAYSSAESARARTWSSVQEKFGAAVCLPLGTSGESLRYFRLGTLFSYFIYCARVPPPPNWVARFSSSKLDLTFYWRIQCDEMGRVQHKARLVPNIVDSSLSKCVAHALAFASLS